MTPNIKPKKVFALARERRENKRHSKIREKKRNKEIKIEELKRQIAKLLKEKTIDKSKIAKLKEELEILIKKYNQLDEESIGSSSIFR
jgi:chromosome segregation ATPase